MVNRQGIAIRSRAKINFYLEVLALRPDGYHEIDTVMLPISWSDTLYMAPNPTGEIRFSWVADSGFNQPIPAGAENIVVRSVQRLRERAGETRGLDLFLVKRVPTQAGLGGASSNAAAALRGACRIWEIDWPRERLWQVAAEIGSDVPFFLWDTPARCRGRGEDVQPVQSVGGLPLVMVQPPRGLLTADVYRQADQLTPPGSTPLRSPNELLRRLAQGGLNQIASSLFNRLESAAACILEEIDVARRAFRETPALAFQMSGSGSCCFGLFGSRRAAAMAAARLARILDGFRVATCLSSGSV
ncbi:MAG TPA: 4-(cytidine 5'-diphospho)-2-C-methyl-D-erythritol kinase [Pirellulaceae bacterium]|nr:4-(cytidine 5'-diphospho)-2-C-methyl-D-erythritol kinase [Pirellulaceae bacterium]